MGVKVREFSCRKPMLVQERRNDFFVFPLNAARAVHQHAAALEQGRGAFEQVQLRASVGSSRALRRQRTSTRRRITPVLEQGASIKIRSNGPAFLRSICASALANAGDT